MSNSDSSAIDGIAYGLLGSLIGLGLLAAVGLILAGDPLLLLAR